MSKFPTSRIRLSFCALLIACAAALAVAVLSSCASPEVKQPSSPAPVPMEVKDKQAAEPKPEPEPEPEPEPAPEPREPYYVLLVGNDARFGTVEATGDEAKDKRGRSDVVMLMRVDPENYKISFLTFPRETPITYKDRKCRFNILYYFYGITGTKEGVEQKTGLPIKYYMDLSMPNYVDMFNQLGGQDVNVPIYLELDDVMSGEHIWLEPGEQHLNGPELLVYTRVRKMYVSGDSARQYNNRQLMMRIIQNVASDPASWEEKFSILSSHVTTDWDSEELKEEVKNFVDHADQISFEEGTAPFNGDYNAEYDAWVCYDDPETWSQLIEVFSSGGNPSDVVANPSMDPK